MSQDHLQPIQKANVVQSHLKIAQVVESLGKQQTTVSFKWTTVGQSHKSRCNQQVHNTLAGFLSQHSHNPKSSLTMPPCVYCAYLAKPQNGLQSGHERMASLQNHLFHFHLNLNAKSNLHKKNRTWRCIKKRCVPARSGPTRKVAKVQIYTGTGSENPHPQTCSYYYTRVLYVDSMYSKRRFWVYLALGEGHIRLFDKKDEEGLLGVLQTPKSAHTNTESSTGNPN